MTTYDGAIQHLRRFAAAHPEHRGIVATLTGDVNLLEAERRAAVADLELANETIEDLRDQIAAAPTEPSPSEGIEQVAELQRGETVAAALERMAAGPCSPGGGSLLMLPAGAYGPLELTAAHAALLTGRLLRIGGPHGASIAGLTMAPSAGIANCIVELWRVALRGNVAVTSAGFGLRTMNGATIRAAADAGPGVPV